MYSIIRAFGINYAENSSIIKQIKKPETGDPAGSPSEGMDGVGSLDPAEGPERRGGACTGADTRPEEAKACREQGIETPESCLCGPFLPHSEASFAIKTLLPLPGILPGRDLSSAEQPSIVKARGAPWGWDSEKRRKAGVRMGLSWSRPGCGGAGTAEASGCHGHGEPSLALVRAPGFLPLS